MPIKALSDNDFKRVLTEIEQLGASNLPLTQIIEKLNLVILNESLSDKTIAWSIHEPNIASWNMACGGVWVNTDNPEGASSTNPVTNPTEKGTIGYHYRIALCATIISTLNKLNIKGMALQEAPLDGDIFYPTLRSEKINVWPNPTPKGFQKAGKFNPTMSTALVGTAQSGKTIPSWLNALLTTYNIHDKEIQMGILGDRCLITIHFEYLPTINRNGSNMNPQEKAIAISNRINFLEKLSGKPAYVLMGDVNRSLNEMTSVPGVETYGALGCNTVDIILSVNTSTVHHHALAKIKLAESYRPQGHQSSASAASASPPIPQHSASAASAAPYPYVQQYSAAGASAAPKRQSHNPSPALFASNRLDLVEVFQQTKKASHKYNSQLMIDESKSFEFIPVEGGTTALRVSYSDAALQQGAENGVFSELPSDIEQDQNQNSRPTTYQVINQDSFVAASQLQNPLVLNMANKYSIGGGVEGGSLAQEETLFRCSNYHEGLYPLGFKDKQTGRVKYNQEIPEFGAHYTPHIAVFRDATNQYNFLQQPFEVACVAIAGYDLGKPNQLERSLQGLSESALLLKFKNLTKMKLRLLLEIAIEEKHENLVLGAISCGAFKLRNDNTGKTASMVAEAYAEVLGEPEYQNKFKNITFAIFDAHPNQFSNFTIFTNKLQHLLAVNSPASVNNNSGAAAAASSPARGYRGRDYLLEHHSIRTSWSNDNKVIIFAKKDDADKFVRFLLADSQLRMGSVTHAGRPKTVQKDGNAFKVFLTKKQWETFKAVKRSNSSASSYSAAPETGFKFNR